MVVHYRLDLYLASQSMDLRSIEDEVLAHKLIAVGEIEKMDVTT